MNNGRSVKVHVLVGRALLKGDFFIFECDVSGVTDLLVLLVVDDTFFKSTLFCYKKNINIVSCIYLISIKNIIMSND